MCAQEELACAQKELGASQSHGRRVEKLTPKLQNQDATLGHVEEKLQESLTEVDITSGNRCGQWLLQEAEQEQLHKHIGELEAAVSPSEPPLGDTASGKERGQGFSSPMFAFCPAQAEMSQEEQRAAHGTPEEQQKMHTAELLAPGRDSAQVSPHNSIDREVAPPPRATRACGRSNPGLWKMGYHPLKDHTCTNTPHFP